jgi:hypothetical protein
MNDDKDWKLDELALCPIDQWHNDTVANRREQLPINHHEEPPPTKLGIMFTILMHYATLHNNYHLLLNDTRIVFWKQMML